MREIYDWLITHNEQASALNAIASTAIALFAMVAAFASVFLTLKTVQLQRRHNVISIKPIPTLRFEFLKDRIELSLLNGGLGPLIIVEFSIYNEGIQFSDFRDLLRDIKFPDAERYFGLSFHRRPIQPGDYRSIFKLSPKHPHDKLEVSDRIKLTEAFGEFTLRIQYTDLYGTDFKVYEKMLSEFR